MNTYRYTFSAACPGNGEQIIYRLELSHQNMVRVEHIKTACALHKEGFQEVIADDLHQRFGVETSCADLAAQHGIPERTIYRWAQMSNDVTRQITDRHLKAKPQ